MTLYFDTKLQFFDAAAVSTVGSAHSKEPLVAIASYSSDQGGSVTIFDDSGEPVRDVSFPVHGTSQATTLRWHPDKRLLVSGWENGEVHAWFASNREFSTINGPHKAPIIALEFSEQGGRMVTADSVGMLTGWRCDHHGQFLTMFTHDLRDPVLHITFRRTIPNTTNTELTNLARAAVAGDESALDTLTNWRPRTAARKAAHAGVQDNHCFYVATESGVLYYLNQSGNCTEILRSDGAPYSQVLWHPKRDALVVLMDDMTVAHFLVESSGMLTELDRVKLSGRISGQSGAISWAANSLAIITGDFSVRIWDIDTSDNFLLPLNDATKAQPAGGGLTMTTHEVFTCIAYCAENQTLCAGTNQGNVFTWKRTHSFATPDEPELAWQMNNVASVRGAIKQCGWGVCETASSCILVNCVANVFILKEQPLCTAHTRHIWATQKSAHQICVHTAAGKSQYLHSDFAVNNLCVGAQLLVVSNDRQMVVHKIENGAAATSSDAAAATAFSVTYQKAFGAESVRVFLYDETIIALTPTCVNVISLGGVTLKQIAFSEAEGKPIGASLTANYLAVFTMNGFIKLYDVVRHEPRQLAPTKCGYDMFSAFGEVMAAKCNATGTMVALTVANESLQPDGKLYVWHLERDSVRSFDFLDGSGGASLRLPINFVWDTDDPRLIACETRCVGSVKENRAATSTTVAECQVNVMFVTEKGDTKELQQVALATGELMVNLCIPNVITLKATQIERIALRDFRGLEDADEATRRIVLDFSLLVAEGNMDAAFRCIRSIQSAHVWQNLAQMCVHTGRLDVARVCLGHMNMARSVRALRRAMADDSLEPDARVAVLAIELGMIDEAETLYKKCGRHDLLNRLLQAGGRYAEALQLAEQLDRVHLKNTYYRYAEHLKGAGDVQGALEYYDKCQNATHNVTQMLMEDPVALRQHMQTATDPKLLKWWAQYVESTGDMESAFKIYQKADDWFSQVRILCFLGQLARADSVARLSGDKSACYHLARHYENIGKLPEAIQFYTRAETYGNAVRICKEHDLHDDLWHVASLAHGRDKATAAAYYEEMGDFKRAVELYHRAGQLHKAVEMAFASQQPETLQVIASELDASSDGELVARCAEFFLGIDQPHKAVQLLASAQQYERALAIAAERAVPLTETLADLLTPGKDAVADDAARMRMLVALGELLHAQGDYHTATKKFTQGGDKVRAMKSLLKSGDTDKIVFFAGMSRQRDVYVMAANYLQSLDWQADGKVLKHIVTFYTKAQVWDLLANFYASCGQVEIDEFRDYEKALNAFQEAARCLAKVTTGVQQQRAADGLQVTVLEVRKVVEVQQALERGENSNVAAVCRSILSQPERPPIRQSDVHGFLVEALIRSNQFADGLSALRELALRAPDWSSSGLVDRALVERLAKECHVDFEQLWNSGRRKRRDANGQETGGAFDDEDDEVVEEIVEVMERHAY